MITKVINLSSEHLAYLAGIIDGEGCISVYLQKKGTLVVRIIIGNTNPLLVNWLKTHVTGLGNVHFKPSQRPNWKGCWVWECSTRAAEAVLIAVRPWLVLKAAQADLVISALKVKIPAGTPMTLDRMSFYKDIVAKAHELNTKGIAA